MNITVFLVVAAAIGLFVTLLGVVGLAVSYLVRRRGSTAERIAK